MILQAKSTYSPLGKAFQKQRKAIEYEGKKQTNALDSLNFLNKINDLKKGGDIF